MLLSIPLCEPRGRTSVTRKSAIPSSTVTPRRESLFAPEIPVAQFSSPLNPPVGWRRSHALIDRCSTEQPTFNTPSTVSAAPYSMITSQVRVAGDWVNVAGLRTIVGVFAHRSVSGNRDTIRIRLIRSRYRRRRPWINASSASRPVLCRSTIVRKFGEGGQRTPPDPGFVLFTGATDAPPESGPFNPQIIRVGEEGNYRGCIFCIRIWIIISKSMNHLFGALGTHVYSPRPRIALRKGLDLPRIASAVSARPFEVVCGAVTGRFEAGLLKPDDGSRRNWTGSGQIQLHDLFYLILAKRQEF